jgi:hypothetical protein
MPEGLAQWGQELFMTRELERRRDLAPENCPGKDIVQRGFEPCLLASLRLSVGRDPGTWTAWTFWAAWARSLAAPTRTPSMSSSRRCAVVPSCSLN